MPSHPSAYHEELRGSGHQETPDWPRTWHRIQGQPLHLPEHEAQGLPGETQLGRTLRGICEKARGGTRGSSKPKGEQRFTDHLIGISFINSDLINNSGSISSDGERYGEQLYGSLSLRDTFSKNQLNFTPKLKINYGMNM